MIRESYMFITDQHLIPDGADWREIAKKMDYIYKYLSYNFEVYDLIVIVDIDGADSIEMLKNTVIDQYFKNRTVLESTTTVIMDDLADKTEEHEIIDVFNVFIKSVIKKYNTVSLN